MTDSLEWIVISNPLSGRRKDRRTRDRVVGALKGHQSSFVLIEEVSSHDATTKLCPLLDSSTDLKGVIVVGGDGTVHQTVNAINRLSSERATTTPFGVVPAGTGNDFATQCGLNRLSPEELVTLFVSTPPSKIDVISVNDLVCLQVLSTGFDACISERSKGLPSFLGNARYVLALLSELIRLKTIPFDLEIDGSTFQRSALMVSCASGRNYGGGMLISPNSDHQDGRLECIILHPVSRMELLRVFPRIFSGTHIDHPAFEVKGFRRLSLRAATIAQGDGEAMFDRPVDLEVGIKPMLTWKT